MKINTILFDLDGTLVDTSAGIINSIQYTIKKLQLPSLSEQMLYSFIGPPVKKRMMEIYQLSEESAAYAMQIFREKYGEEDLFQAQIYSGVKETLSALGQHFQLGVATYKREDQAENLLKKMRLDKFFDIICGSDSQAKLSKSDIIKKAYIGLSAKPQGTVLVGDSENDAVGAYEAGIHFIGVTYGFGFKGAAELEQYSHIGVAIDIKEIQIILSTINNNCIRFENNYDRSCNII